MLVAHVVRQKTVQILSKTEEGLNSENEQNNTDNNLLFFSIFNVPMIRFICWLFFESS